MQESPRDLHPSPHLRKKRKRKVPTTPHPTHITPHPQQHLSVPSAAHHARVEEEL